MAGASDDLESLLEDVRKIINDNKRFLEKLVDEANEVESDDVSEVVSGEDDFEEL